MRRPGKRIFIYSLRLSETQAKIAKAFMSCPFEYASLHQGVMMVACVYIELR